jgi:hypothetical protein
MFGKGGVEMAVRHELLKQMDKLGYSRRKLAKVAGFSDHSKLSDHLNENVASELNFDAMVDVANVLYENPCVILNQYALEVERDMNKKAALEYCSMNRQLETGNELLRQLRKSNKDNNDHDNNNVTNKKNSKDKDNDKKGNLSEWIEVYDLVYKSVKVKQPDGSFAPTITPEEVLNKLKEIKVKPPELKIMLQMLQSYAYQAQKKFELCYASFEGINNLIKQVTIEYFKSSLETRYKELAGFLCLMVFGDIKTSRKYSCDLTNNPKVGVGYRATAHYILGTSYMFESLEKTVYHLEKSIELFTKSTRPETNIFLKNYLLPLAYIIHNEFTMGAKTTDKSLLAYLNAKLNNNKKALEYLDEFVQENGTTPFTQFVKGVVTNDYRTLSDSMARYEEKGDMFYVHLPRFSLIGLGFPKDLINDRIKYKLKSFEGVEEFEKTYFRNVSSIDSFRYKRQHG